ncbi:hypothetical protein EU527_19510 [Candidatus Thorarchaeota archaeon]|nr:MAG: hypothetical protein EU527_19510 [Candidatus Thorarchaeota archaeon]
MMQTTTQKSSPKMHPILIFISKAPMKLTHMMILIGILTYTVFIVLTLVTGQISHVLFSFMHLVQLDFSLLITIGLFFLQNYYNTLFERLREIRYVFVIDDDEYDLYLDQLNKKMSDVRGALLGIPFIILAILSIVFFVMPTMPNELFPVESFSPIWIYLSIVEFSFLMLPLFGIAIWLGVVVMSASKDIGRRLKISVEPISPDRAGGLVSFSEVLLRGVFMYSLLLVLLIPLLVYLVHNLSYIGPFLSLIPTIGLVLAIVTICIFFLVPQYYIHNILEEEKKKHLSQVSRELNATLFEIRNALSSAQSKSDIPSQQLTFLSLQLTTLFEQVEKMKTWPSTLWIAAKAISSLFLILLTFFINQLLVIYLELLFS